MRAPVLLAVHRNAVFTMPDFGDVVVIGAGVQTLGLSRIPNGLEPSGTHFYILNNGISQPSMHPRCTLGGVSAGGDDQHRLGDGPNCSGMLTVILKDEPCQHLQGGAEVLQDFERVCGRLCCLQLHRNAVVTMSECGDVVVIGAGFQTLGLTRAPKG